MSRNDKLVTDVDNAIPKSPSTNKSVFNSEKHKAALKLLDPAQLRLEHRHLRQKEVGSFRRLCDRLAELGVTDTVGHVWQVNAVFTHSTDSNDVSAFTINSLFARGLTGFRHMASDLKEGDRDTYAHRREKAQSDSEAVQLYSKWVAYRAARSRVQKALLFQQREQPVIS